MAALETNIIKQQAQRGSKHSTKKQQKGRLDDNKISRNAY
jgi:hypothetical protein